MIRRKKFFFLWILIPILILSIIGLLFIHYFLDPDLYKNMIQESLASALGREVTIGKAKLNLWGGVGIAFEDFRIKDRSLSFDIIQSQRLILKAKILPLFRKEVQWKRIVIDKPVLRLIRNKEGRFNFSDGELTLENLKISQEKILQAIATLFGGSLTLRDGVISFSDEGQGTPPIVTELRSFNFQLSKISYHRPFPFHISGEIRHSQKKGRFSITGTIRDIPEEMDIAKGNVNAEVELSEFEVSHFWPYLKTILPMKMISGTFDLKGQYQGNFLGPFRTSAKIKIKELSFDYPQVFAYVLAHKWANIDFDVDYDVRNFSVRQLSLQLPEIWVKGKGRIYAIGSKDMGMEAEAQSGPFDIEVGRKFIPFRIITPQVSDPLFRAEGNGPIQILSVRLAGKMPEIDHCDQPQNAHTLSVALKLDKARLKLPWNLPAFEDIKGLLLFKNGNLEIKETEGRLFHSRLDRINGLLQELLQVPFMDLHGEGRMDLADLPSFAKIEGLSEDLSDFLSQVAFVSGRAQYQLSVKGALKPPLRFQHQGTYRLSRTRLIHRQIPFPISIGEGKIDLSNNNLQWSGARVEFGSSSLLLNGALRKGEKAEPFEIAAKGKVDLNNLFRLFKSPFFPDAYRMKLKEIANLSGSGELSFKGHRPKDNRPFFFQGDLISNGISFFPMGISSPLVIKEGGLSFSNIGIGLSRVKTQFTNSSLTLDGNIKEGQLNLSTWGSIDFKYLSTLLKSPLFPDDLRSQMEDFQELQGGAEVRLKWAGRMEDWTTVLREGDIQMKGIFLRHRKITFPLSLAAGHFILSPREIRFDGLDGKMGESPLNLSGSLSRNVFSSPNREKTDPFPSDQVKKLSFQIYSPRMDFDPLFPKREEKKNVSFTKIRELLSEWTIDGKVQIAQGKYQSLRFQEFNAEMKKVDDRLFLHPFQFKTEGGDFWGEGWIQPFGRGIRFEIKPRLSNMEARAFLGTLFPKGKDDRVVVTGRVHIDKTDLHGEGEILQKIKESLNGSLRLEFENGVIERFNLLAKIFSILNVSQLLKGRLPDLATKGLPYRQILATIQVKDGIATTEDFVVDSDSMRITLFGKVDLGKNIIDAKIGIHPLVTVDTVISNVPIAGWSLTGKDKAFLSFIYEIKGNLDDPKIEAIPIKSLGEGFWGIVKRLVETPVRPFQKNPATGK